ncbi:Excisionase [Candidatus Hamiltonella defensa (Bemisia tabaci)]|nr:Excisionase [Candidatus Hamiltonella defensa (Bemisia tabaci)]
MKQLLAQFVENTLSDGSKANLPPSDKEYLTVDEAAGLCRSKTFLHLPFDP